jgi:hypothetical protein
VPRSADVASGRWASLALPAVLVLVLLLGLVLVAPDGALVDCERDGHFQRAGWVSCGVVGTNAPYGPLLPWLVAPLVPLVGTPYIAGRLLSLLALLGVVVLGARSVRGLGGGPWLAALAALAVGLNGPMLFYGSMACSDLPAAALFLLACWLALRALEPRAPLWLVGLAGAALAGACLVRVQYYIAAPVLLVAWALLARRAIPVLVLTLGFLLPVAGALADGWAHYGGPVDAAELHLGLSAYTRNLRRAGTILDAGAAGSGDVVSLGARLRWSVALIARATGGLPLLGCLAALVLALRRPRWRRLLVVLLPALALYAGLAWSHPPPDWGARRFYLFLVPLCVVPSLLLGRVVVERWLPSSRGLPALAVVLVLLGASAHGLWEIRSFRAPQLGSLLQLGDDAPRGVAGSYDRQVVARAAQLVAELEPCAAVATNFHAVTTAFRCGFFLGDVSPGELPRGIDALPLAAHEPLWWVEVPPDGKSLPTLRQIRPSAEPPPRLGELP